MQSLILASSSPRRQELLSYLQVPFEVVVSHADENFDSHLQPQEVVMLLAEKKAKHVHDLHPQSIVIGADTVVVAGGTILGKPASSAEAFDMLKRLSGSDHEVYTGVSIVSNEKTETFFEKTKVVFWELSDEEIHSYIETNEPFDKAGSYGIQGYGRILVHHIEGDYFNVVGLPISRLVREWKKFLS